MAIRVLLLDDHEIVRRGIAQLLETQDDIEVVGEAGTAPPSPTTRPSSARSWPGRRATSSSK
jgi:DNA-binding NarL/FixJ family response regulator